MSEYLVFQLHGPMASWGENAPGEVRHTGELPTRSALLGLLAAALGIRRDEDEKLAHFHRHYQFLIRASKAARWARDYHSVQMPKASRNVRYISRREELQDRLNLETLITKRDYYSDAWWVVAVAHTDGAPYTLEQLANALRNPVFPLYLGRKSHPLALPLDALCIEGDAASVLEKAVDAYRSKLSALGINTLPDMHNVCWWEGEHDGLHKQQTLSRRDRPVSRQQWLFAERDFYKGIPLKEDACISQK